MKKIGLAPNPKREEAVKFTAELIPFLKSQNTIPYVINDVHAAIDTDVEAICDNDMHNMDLIVVLGGDGTMLRWCNIICPHPTPIIGVNFGKYGFITELSPENAKDALCDIINGKYSISERSPLAAKIIRNGEPVEMYYAFNDAILSRGLTARVVEFEIYISGKYIVTHAADGIIFSTPTGSTGYSLSAGGPVVSPELQVFIITPICPHTLNARPLIIPTSEIIEIVPKNNDLVMMVDGCPAIKIDNNEKIEISKVEFMARFVQMKQTSFYDKLRDRLRWGERFKS